MERNSRIRFQIMLIALIGGLAFAFYLMVNVLLAATNATRLDELQNHQFPILEDIRQLRQDLNAIREGVAAAIGLEDRMLLEDARQIAAQARQTLEHLAGEDADMAREIAVIQPAFERYVEPAFSLAEVLVQAPQRVQEYSAASGLSIQAHAALMAQLKTLLGKRQQQYSALLQKTNNAVNQANLWGALLGLAVIATLIVLAWTISRRVIRQINESDLLKDEFLATISHELRTPMNGIIGALSLLHGTHLDDEQSGWVDVANRSASGMMLSIDDLLQFSEVNAGRSGVHLAPFQLRPGLEKLLQSQQAEFAEKDLQLEFYGGTILDRVIVSHEAKVLHVIRHLLNNALKFTGRGTVSLSVQQAAVASADGAMQIRVLVQDTGPGISPGQIDYLFKPFRQLDGSFSRRHQGMGIGLATCYAIAKLIKGSLTLRNRTIGGLEVEFVFPVQFADSADPAGPPREKPGTIRSSRDKVVMVVEDNLVNLLVLKGRLRRLGYRVLSARDGRQALDLMQSKMVDLVLMDCQMPVMDGFEATRRIRQLPHPLCVTPIVALTANAMESDRERCMQAGMNAYLKKPVELDLLQSVLYTELDTVPA